MADEVHLEIRFMTDNSLTSQLGAVIRLIQLISFAQLKSDDTLIPSTVPIV